MKILIITQYFPPEVGAPQNRLYELAIRLNQMGAEIHVITSMPNYPQMKVYKGYEDKFFLHEKMGEMMVFRSYVYVKNSKSIIARLINYFSFVFSSLYSGLFKVKGKFDIVFCESPPLFLGISAYIISKVKRSKFVFNVSDLWPETAEQLGIITNKVFLKLATLLEEFLYRKSVLITGQTQGIVSNIKNRFRNKHVFWLPNGVDISYYKPSHIQSNWRKSNGFSTEDFLLLYAGIIGHAQGLEVIIEAARILEKNEKIKFLIIGSGPVKEKLQKMTSEFRLKNIFFFDAQPKSEMPFIVKDIDASIIPLKKLDLFKGAIPSKIFEILAMEKPIILGVEGEAKSLFIDEGNAGVAFEPENANDLALKINSLFSNPELLNVYGKNGRLYVADNFSRDEIAKKFFHLLKEVVSKS